WMARDMTAPDGGFYAAVDADSEGVEGRFYTWTPDEIAAALGPRGAEFATAYFDVAAEGQVDGRSVLHVAEPIAALAARQGLTVDEATGLLVPVRAALLDARGRRPRPRRRRQGGRGVDRLGDPRLRRRGAGVRGAALRGGGGPRRDRGPRPARRRRPPAAQCARRRGDRARLPRRLCVPHRRPARSVRGDRRSALARARARVPGDARRRLHRSRRRLLPDRLRRRGPPGSREARLRRLRALGQLGRPGESPPAPRADGRRSLAGTGRDAAARFRTRARRQPADAAAHALRARHGARPAEGDRHRHAPGRP